MAKYIDVESLVVAYSGHTPDDQFSKGVNFVLDLLDSKPPADVHPVVRGCWVFNEEDGHYYCSECGGVSPMDDQNGDECDCPNYCHNCGADMRDC